MIEIRWHGRGGQGAKTASLLLADAAFNTGRYIQGFPEYGPERMGAPITAYNRISTEPITIHSNIYEPDYVVVVDDTLLDSVDVTAGLKENGAIVINITKDAEEIKSKLKDYQNNKSYNQVRGEHGIYIIYMNEDLLLNYKLVYNFNENGTGGKFKEYREYNLKKGDCIYLGTCISKSLFSRLHQHFENSNCYGSLQLGNEFRKILKDKIKIFAFPIKSSCNEILLKNIEKRLHEILNPTNGSKRV